jgi:hypothetical protein
MFSGGAFYISGAKVAKSSTPAENENARTTRKRFKLASTTRKSKMQLLVLASTPRKHVDVFPF